MMTKIWAHRGYSGKYPENTMLAFQKAVEVGVDGIELDVQLTRDGEVVILHDETLNRTTNGAGFLADITLRELRQLNANVKFPAFGPQVVPTFREYLEFAAPRGVFTNIELKTGENPYPGIEEKVWALVRAFHMEELVLFSSFRDESLRRIQAVAPGIPCGYLSSDWTADLPEHILSLGLQACHPLYLDLSAARIKRLHKAGLPVHTYTPNSDGGLKRLLRWNVDAVITNEPVRAKMIREQFEV